MARSLWNLDQTATGAGGKGSCHAIAVFEHTNDCRKALQSFRVDLRERENCQPIRMIDERMDGRMSFHVEHLDQVRHGPVRSRTKVAQGRDHGCRILIDRFDQFGHDNHRVGIDP